MLRLVTPETVRPNTIEELNTLVSSHKNEDVIASIGEISLKEDKIIVRDSSYAIRPSGFKGLLQHIKMPLGYASSIPNDLLYDSVNRLTSKTYADSEVLLRIQDNELRAVLSPNYVPLDTTELMKHVSKAEALGLKPARITYDNDNILLSMVTEAEVKAKQVGDISKIGISLGTSDVGDTPLNAGAFLYRLLCTNGAILPVSFAGGMSFDQKKANPESIWSIFSSGFDKILHKMSQVDSEFLIRLEQTEVTAATFIKAKNKISQYAGGRKVDHLLKEMESDILDKDAKYTVFDIYNKITESAHRQPNLQDQRSLEMGAGELLLDFASLKATN
jgi:hypothetical protein